MAYENSLFVLNSDTDLSSKKPKLSGRKLYCWIACTKQHTFMCGENKMPQAN